MHIIRTVEELERWQAEWDRLADQLQNPFLRNDWLSSCAETLHDTGQLRIVVQPSAGALVAAAPLATVRSHGHERLEILGSSVMLEPSGLLYRDDAALTSLVQALVRLGQPLVLRGLDAGGAAERAIRRVVAERGGGFMVMRPTRASLTLPIRTSWSDYLQHGVSSKMRQDVRRLLSRARALGDIRFEILSPTPADVPRIMETVVAVEGSGWKAQKHASLATNSRLRRFFNAFALRAARRGELRVGLFHIGARTAAVQLCLEAYRRLWALKIGFDETVGSCSPGFLLMHECIRYAHEQRLDAFEFLGSAEAWQARWRPDERPYTSALLYPLSVRGLSGLAMDAIGRGARTLVHPLPQARR
jgi:CelD/BcsL family acetyltransferase involved in cellulose biosynthesis